MIYKYKSNIFSIEEITTAYVSPYSTFFIENFENILLSSKTVCDFGAGTGVLGIVASSYPIESVVAIEPQEHAFNLLKKNTMNNHIEDLFKFLHWGSECLDLFDTIICNPASLPNITHVNSFCDGGELGLDMINEVIEFAQDHLTIDGSLYIIITSILPVSLINEKIRDCELEYKIISTKTIEFREHYSEIKTWVDEMRKVYDEMNYISSNGKLYEKLFLFEVRRKSNYEQN